MLDSIQQFIAQQLVGLALDGNFWATVVVPTITTWFGKLLTKKQIELITSPTVRRWVIRGIAALLVCIVGSLFYGTGAWKVILFLAVCVPLGYWLITQAATFTPKIQAFLKATF